VLGRTTITYSAVGTDDMKIAVDVAPAEGAPQQWEMTAHYDGKESPVTGNPTADMISMKKVNDATGTTADGKPRKDVQVFEK
jgi:hypothetical protein